MPWKGFYPGLKNDKKILTPAAVYYVILRLDRRIQMVSFVLHVLYSVLAPRQPYFLIAGGIV